MSRVVVDEIRRWPTSIACFKAGSCHLMLEADEHGQLDMEALHDFAATIGLRRSWFQPKSSPHYDLTASKRRLALAMGAVFVPGLEQARARLAARALVAPVSPVEAVAHHCDRSTAHARAQAIIAGHSALCATTGDDPACPWPASPSPLGVVLAAIAEQAQQPRPPGYDAKREGSRARWLAAYGGCGR